MNAFVVFGAVVLILLFWLYTLFLRPVLGILRGYLALASAPADLRRIQGKIVESTPVGQVRSGRQGMNIVVEFPNFAGSPVTERFLFLDSQPDRRRYSVGAAIPLTLDERSGSGQPVAMDGGQVAINWKIPALCLGLLGASLFALYRWVALPLWNKSDGNLEALIALFDVPVVGMMAAIYAGVLLLLWVIFRLVSGSVVGGNRQEFKYHGRKATATITGARKTGVRVNHDPQVEFDFEFTTSSGQKVSGSDRELINELQIGTLPAMQERDILYIPEDPSRAVFLSSVNAGGRARSIGKTLSAIFYFVGFIFSAIVVGIALADVLSG